MLQEEPADLGLLQAEAQGTKPLVKSVEKRHE
jgi:hypothetical protein